MNIIYLLTNTSKKQGTRFYIGSKVECLLMPLNNIPTIICSKSKKPYYSSSRNLEFTEDMKRGDRIEASILEIVPDRSKLLERERYYISLHNAVESPDYYNLAQASIGGLTVNYDAMKNKFQETIKSFAANQSQSGKKRNTSQSLGFDCISDLCIHIHEETVKGKNHSEISKALGKQRNFSRVFMKDVNVPKFLLEREKEDLRFSVRDLIDSGASLKRIAEILSIEEITVYYFDSNYSKADKNFQVARSRGQTDEELNMLISRDFILDDLSISQLCEKYGMTRLQVRRALKRFFQSKLKASDFELTQMS